ncbi:hypothetical protein BofuT4_P105120.1 [Botrytis cinerea T4]|uniref:Uncharacterized protein n=1 Tax=Botryotinia fuckeliana (strain T4) TaxID=999810 RepID=G2YAC8_BOTF4|nr:hypothetical protein BofuT4_P105120.1 [Botrytis cinerea T4]
MNKETHDIVAAFILHGEYRRHCTVTIVHQAGCCSARRGEARRTGTCCLHILCYALLVPVPLHHVTKPRYVLMKGYGRAKEVAK